MTHKAIILFFLLLAVAMAQTPPATTYAYAGFTLDTDWQSLATRFPRSSHEFVESYSGTMHLLIADGTEKFRQTLGSLPGKYRVRLAENEAVSGIYFLEFDMASGKIQGLKLSFEKPEEFFTKPYSNQDERFPACGPTLSSLLTQYGKPANSRLWEEEALEHTIRTWRSANEKLTLDCGQYMGRKKVFAVEVTITR
ncbi:MAG: hypothetical protein L0Z53_17300 [Acidobacteriales bacterium]|nr:hypothetical protein [Terriglobales bacterium]